MMLNVSVNFKTDYPSPQGRTGSVLIARGSGFRPIIFAWGGGGSGFSFRDVFYSSERKMQEFLNFFKETRGSLQSRCSCAFSDEFL